jgi:hypothetical protein
MVDSSTSNAPSASGDDRKLVTIDDSYLAPSLEDRVHFFWEKHGRTINLVGALVVVGLAVRWGFEQYAAYRENKIQSAYAAAASSKELEAFATANPNAALSGVARLRVADEAYKSGDFRTASTIYTAAAALLRDTPLTHRARLGAALSLLQAQEPSARPSLETLANDVLLAKACRAEAAYHLAILERDAGRNEDAMRWAVMAASVDTSGLWSQRATQLKESLPTSSVPNSDSAPVSASAVNFSGTKK